MKYLLSFCLLCALFSCTKDKCDPGKIPFGDKCITKGDYTFYFGKAHFYCYPDSVAIGLNEKGFYNVYTFTNEYTKYLVLGSEGESPISKTSNVLLEDCDDTIGNSPYGRWYTFARFDDVEALKNGPKTIKLNLYLKPTLNFEESKTIDSTSIILTKR